MTARRRKEREAQSFEDRLQELQEIVAALEEGELPLLESIEKYRQGIAALKGCRALLEEARQTVEVLSREALEPSASSPPEKEEEEPAIDRKTGAPISEMEDGVDENDLSGDEDSR